MTDTNKILAEAAKEFAAAAMKADGEMRRLASIANTSTVEARIKALTKNEGELEARLKQVQKDILAAQGAVTTAEKRAKEITDTAKVEAGKIVAAAKAEAGKVQSEHAAVIEGMRKLIGAETGVRLA